MSRDKLIKEDSKVQSSKGSEGIVLWLFYHKGCKVFLNGDGFVKRKVRKVLC